MPTAATIALLLAAAAQAQPIPPPQLDLPPIIPPSTSGSGQPLCAPQKLVRLVVRNISPGLAAAAPQAQPRVIYRQGAIYLRSEESPDPQRGQPIVVIAEPDIWMFNPATGTGQHQTDPGPELVVRAPVLPLSPDLPPAFRTLEYGCEYDFLMRANSQVLRQDIPWGETRATMRQVVEGEHVVSILLNERRQTPLLVAYAKAGRTLVLIRYDDYRTELPDRPALFARPSQMRIDETPRGAPRPPPQAQPAPARPPQGARPPPQPRRPRT